MISESQLGIFKERLKNKEYYRDAEDIMFDRLSAEKKSLTKEEPKKGREESEKDRLMLAKLFELNVLLPVLEQIVKLRTEKDDNKLETVKRNFNIACDAIKEQVAVISKDNLVVQENNPSGVEMLARVGEIDGGLKEGENGRLMECVNEINKKVEKLNSSFIGRGEDRKRIDYNKSRVKGITSNLIKHGELLVFDELSDLLDKLNRMLGIETKKKLLKDAKLKKREKRNKTEENSFGKFIMYPEDDFKSELEKLTSEIKNTINSGDNDKIEKKRREAIGAYIAIKKRFRELGDNTKEIQNFLKAYGKIVS